MKPGEVYEADVPQDGGRRPVIVISVEQFNRGNYALVAVCTSSRFRIRSILPNCVPFQAGQFGFTDDCVAQCENLVSIEKTAITSGPHGILDDISLRDVIRSVGYVMGADCEPV